jgi:hypothetical protein
MLRVRPTFFTSDLEGARSLLEGLGLVATEEGEGWAILDGGGGRVELRRVDAGVPANGTTEFAVEIRDPEEFARRTLEAGGTAVVTNAATVRITGRDGFGFLARQTTHGATCADADPRLTVRAIWLTPDLPAAAKTLAAIGAKTGEDLEVSGETIAIDFRAKNGGILCARRAEAAGSGLLAFEYDGDLAAVAEKLAAVGAEVEATAAGLVVNGPGVAFTVMTPSVPML